MTHNGNRTYGKLWLGFKGCLFSSLRTDLKTQSGEKSVKCNQCDYTSSRASQLRIHFKTHSGEKSNKCNQCDYASSGAGNSRTQFKMHSAQCAHCTVGSPCIPCQFQFSIFNILLSTVYNCCTECTKGLDQNHNWLPGVFTTKHWNTYIYVIKYENTVFR